MSGSGDLMSSNDDSNDQSQGADGSSGQNKKAGFNDKGDFVLDDESVRLSHEQARDRAKNLAERARQIHKQMPHAGGHVDSWIEAQVDLLLAPKVNWKQLLRSKLVSEIKRESSFSSPDRRFLGKHKALPGPRAGVPDTLKNVIIAIDTSGSISEQELGMALGQVKQLLDIYKASAHLLYWDTAVRTDEPFTNINEALRVRVAGRGGTDANCVFSYLTSKAYAKKHKSNNLPSIVIMFTDGGFSTPDEKWKKKFRDTVWVICGGLADKFEAPFGKKASFKNED
jgi:predicted metal-dependent peptidase